MNDAKVSAERGKTFETRPDFKIEAVTREVFDRSISVGIGPGITAVVSLPRVRWLERKSA
jgi:hypothetical protein